MSVRNPDQPPKDGIHPGTPERTYFRWDAFSCSFAEKVMQSPLAARQYVDSPDTTASKPHFAIGTALHMAVLQPERYEREVMTEPDINRKSSTERDKLESLKADHPPEIVWLTPEQREEVDSMALAVGGHPLAGRIFRAAQAGKLENELACVWTDEKTGMRCKVRLDSAFPAATAGRIIDLKTYGGASKEDGGFAGFERHAFNMGYHRRSAFYTHGLKMLRGVEWPVVYIVVNKNSHDVMVCNGFDGTLSDPQTSLGRGSLEMREALNRWAACVKANDYPGYAEHAVDLSIPDWAAKNNPEIGETL